MKPTLFTVVFYSKLFRCALEKQIAGFDEAVNFAHEVNGRIKEIYHYGY